LVYAEKSGVTALRNATSIHVTGHTAQAMTPDGCLRYDAPSARLSRPRLSGVVWKLAEPPSPAFQTAPHVAWL